MNPIRAILNSPWFVKDESRFEEELLVACYEERQCDVYGIMCCLSAGEGKVLDSRRYVTTIRDTRVEVLQHFYGYFYWIASYS